ncbi:MAG TPA: hypothetical protein ENN21_03090 [Spirochaetes bacterium]|nr:hypothetical protein [Spirochaetota bacterium]
MAQKLIVEKFKGERMEVAGAVFHENKEVAKEIKRIIQDGKILSALWDDEQNCEIIYEVKAEGLKDKLAEWIEYRPFK